MKSGPWRILVADDDPTVGLLARAALAGDDFAVTVVTDGDAALAALEREPHDLALLDVEMPGQDGLAVCAAIRGGPAAGLPVLLISGRDDPAFLAKARELDATRLAKPVDWKRLPTFVRALLG